MSDLLAFTPNVIIYFKIHTFLTSSLKYRLILYEKDRKITCVNIIHPNMPHCGTRRVLMQIFGVVNQNAILHTNAFVNHRDNHNICDRIR